MEQRTHESLPDHVEVGLDRLLEPRIRFERALDFLLGPAVTRTTDGGRQLAFQCGASQPVRGDGEGVQEDPGVAQLPPKDVADKRLQSLVGDRTSLAAPVESAVSELAQRRRARRR
jgi:hypothetical protein